jgi:monovalent cation:H+ antiporter-2, CPA2 family
MHGTEDFLHDLAVVMIVAGLVTIVFHLLKQPVVLGYIIAGVIIGPHTPPFPLIHDPKTINTLAELGVVFLLFSLGLEFSFRKLKKVGVTALIAATLEILLMVWVGYEVGQLFGWSSMNSIFLGAMLSISSTTIIVKALGELGKTKEHFSQLIFGILIVEDILAIVMIALLSSIAMSGSLQAGEVLSTVTRLGIFLVVALVVGLLTVPRLLGYVGKFKSNEMLLVTVLGLCFGVSLLAIKLGYSVALGAFVIGAVIAESREIGKIEHLMEPVRDMFSAVFFVTIGLLIDPTMLLKYWLPILVITFAVIVGKVLTCSLGAFVAGNDRPTSLRVGMGLAQIGEFSFIIAQLGLTLKVTSDFLYPIAVTVSAITTLLTPYLIKSSDAFVGWFDRIAPRGVATSLDVYTRRVSELASNRSSHGAGRFVRRWSWQIGLNVALTAGVFVAAVFLRARHPAWLDRMPVPHRWFDAAIWAAAVLISMPMLIASFRKLQAMAMLVGEVSGHKIADRSTRGIVQAIVSRSILITGTIVLAIVLLLLSSTLLPSGNTLIVLVALLAGITALLWRSFVRVYSKAQISLRETLDQPPATRADERSSPLAGLLEKAELASVTLPPESSASGRLIREIQLRTATGASIVGIERAGETTVNPGPDEELLAGDKVLLLGQRSQLDKARELLSGSSAGERQAAHR